MGAVFSFIGTVVSYGLYTGAFALTAFGLFLYLTKPKDDSLKSILNQVVPQSTNPLENLARSVGTSIAGAALSHNIKDFVFFKLAEVNIPNGETLRFVGAANTWGQNPADFIPGNSRRTIR